MDDIRNADGTFKKGVSGNPSGRTKGTKQAISNSLLEELQEKDDGKTNLELIIRKLVSKAKSGDLKAIEIIIDRIEGKAKEYVELTQTIVEIEDMDDDKSSEDEAEDESDNSESKENPPRNTVEGLQGEN